MLSRLSHNSKSYQKEAQIGVYATSQPTMQLFQQIFRHMRFAERNSFCSRMQNGGDCARALHDGGGVEDIGLVLGLWMLIILPGE